MNLLRPLSPHRPIVQICVRYLFLATIVLFFYLLCLKIGLIGCFFSWVSKVGFLLVGRALSFFFIKMGCSGGLAWAFALVCKAFLTAEATPFVLYMVPSGASTYPTQEAPSVPDLTQGLHTDSGDPGSIIYRAPSPGGPVEILEIPESPSNPSPGPSQPVPPLPASSGTSSSDSTAKPSPSALDQRADELLEKNIKSLKTSLGEGERISEVRETIKENLDVKNPGEEFELIKNIEREVNLNDKKCEGEKMQSSLNEVTEKKGECPITIIELNEIKNHEALTQDGKGGGKPTDCSFQEKGKADE